MERFGRRRALVRIVVVWAVSAGTLLLLAQWMPGFHITQARDAFLGAALLGLANALVWPLLIRLALPITVLTLGLGGLVLNAAVVVVVLNLTPGVYVDNWLSGFGVAVGMTIMNTAATNLLSLDDDDFYYRHVVRQAARTPAAHTDIPGLVLLQIDGLSYDVLRRAFRSGDAPTMASWVADGSHEMSPWETDWSSQTGASQAGILLGSNADMPAFRWYEKWQARVLVSNHPRDAAEIERRHSTGRGLLHADGAGRNNLFTGDAPYTLLTMSVVGRKRGRLGEGYFPYFANPYNGIRSMNAFIAEVFRERRQAADQRRRNVQPRLAHRGGVYPFVRAFTTVISRDVTVQAVLGDMMAGRSVVYADLLGYDEVAHHSGIERYDALRVLRDIDRQIGRLAGAARLAPRPYRFVVLSDHGQSQGETFADRYGLTLEQLVRDACGLAAGPGRDEHRQDVGAEGWAQLAMARPEGHPHDPPHQRAEVEERGQADQVVVLGSGNLGLVYLTAFDGRATLEEIEARYPGLLPALAGHPGVGFAMVRSAERGPVAVGAAGRHWLADGTVDGEDPLAAFGPLAAARLVRTDGMAACADIMVNSVYEPAMEQVAAFEGLVGSHGGMGGEQTRAFVLHPATLPYRDEPVVGAEQLHQVLRGWLADLGHAAYREPLPELPAWRTAGLPDPAADRAVTSAEGSAAPV